VIAIEIANAPRNVKIVAKTARSNKPAAMAPARLVKPTARRSGMSSVGDMTNEGGSRFATARRNKVPKLRNAGVLAIPRKVPRSRSPSA
jgi:hypothetical protein